MSGRATKITLEKISPYLAKGLGISDKALAQCFSPATREDLDEIVQFRQSLFGGDAPWDDKSYLDWRYSFDGTGTEQNCIWIFKKESKIIGCLGIERVNLHFPGTLMPAYKAMDILVAPVFDGKGLGAWMNLYLMSIYSVIIVMGSNDNSHSLLMRLFHQISHTRIYKLPVRSNQFLQKKLKSSLLSRLVSIPFDLLLFARRKLQWSRIEKDISTRELSKIPVDMDQLDSGREDRVYIQRTSEYLTWRYINNPRREFTIIGLFKGKELAGITVCQLFFSESSQQLEATILDWFFRESGTDINYNVLTLQQSISLLIAKGACAVNVEACCNYCDDVFRKLGFIVCDTASPFFVYVRDNELQEQLYDENKWFLTEGDYDTDMY
jgi:hypothetical protein